MFYIRQQIDSAIELLEKGEAVDISQLPPVPSVPQASSGMFTTVFLVMAIIIIKQRINLRKLFIVAKHYLINNCYPAEVLVS